jgi:hypothetical protein
MAEAAMNSLRALARQLGGDAYSHYILVPGPGHSRCDRSLMVTLDPAAPEGFRVHTFSERDD